MNYQLKILISRGSRSKKVGSIYSKVPQQIEHMKKYLAKGHFDVVLNGSVIRAVYDDKQHFIMIDGEGFEKQGVYTLYLILRDDAKTCFEVEFREGSTKKQRYVAMREALPRRFVVLKNKEGYLHIDVSQLCPKGSKCYGVIEKEPGIHMSIPIQNGQMKTRFNRRKHPSGIYTVTIKGEDESEQDKIIWQQYIYMQWPSNTLSEEKIEALAKKYQPIVVYNFDESYFPMAIEELFAEISRIEKIATVKLPDAEDDIPYNKLGEYMATNGHKEALLRFSDDLIQRDLVALTGDKKSATVYYSYMEDRNKFYINYHFFYGYDSKLADVKHFTIRDVGVHNLDRESMTLVFEKGRKTPCSVVTSAHLRGQEMSLVGKNDKDAEQYTTWDNGRVVVPYEQMVVGTLPNPIVAIAKGSHAVYPIEGWYMLDVLPGIDIPISKVVEPAGLMVFENDGVSAKEESIYLLPQVDNRVDGNRYSLKPLKIGDFSVDSPMHFSGYWIDGIGDVNSRFSPYLERERFISQWVDKATPFDMQHIPLLSEKVRAYTEKVVQESML